MTNRTVAAAVVRVALLPASEWTDDDLALLLKPEERVGHPTGHSTASAPEPWLVRARAVLMLARVVEKVFDYGGEFAFPSDEDALEFAVSEAKR